MTVVLSSILLGRRSCFLHARAALLVSLLVSVSMVAVPRVVSAQTPPTILTVVCRSVADVPVADIAIVVVDARSDTPLVEGTTDTHGRVRFPPLAPAAVRVRLTGTLQPGVTLRHTRQDQRGIWAQLPGHDWTMALRVDTDGLVFPDLDAASAGALDAEAATAISLGTMPTVSVGAAAATTPSVGTVAGAYPAAVVTARPQPSIQGSYGSGLVVLAVLLSALGGVTWLLVRGKD